MFQSFGHLDFKTLQFLYYVLVSLGEGQPEYNENVKFKNSWILGCPKGVEKKWLFLPGDLPLTISGVKSWNLLF